MHPQQTARALVQYATTHNIAHKAAALSYYAILSIVPVFILLVAGARLILHQNQTVLRDVFMFLESVIGTDSVQLLQEAIDGANPLEGNILFAVIGGAIFILITVRLLSTAGTFLDTLWGITRPRSFRKMVLSKLVIILVLLITFLLFILATLLSTSLGAFNEYLTAVFGGSLGSIQGMVFIVIVLFIYGNIVLSFRFLPHQTLPWKYILHGPGITTALIAIGQVAAGLYFQYIHVGSAYGLIGSFFVLLLWVYYSSFLYLLGAGITHLYHTATTTE